MVYRFQTPLWVYSGENAWYFVTVPEDASDDIAARTEYLRRGFGSVRVKVTVGATTWNTSVFPDSKAGAYVLPVKKQVRVAEHLEAGKLVTVTLEVVQSP
jgi:Domain of unknown function (DUF1905)